MVTKKMALMLLALVVLSSVDVYARDSEQQEFRGVWIATVFNINWPVRGASAEDQKAHFIRLLDEAVAMRMNAVVVQIRPTADAFYRSELNPWSEWLTGTQGQDPGYDPLAFMIEESHNRGLEFHAWFNPFRVSMSTNPREWAPNSVMTLHPDRVREYNGQLWLDPGIPSVRQMVIDSIMEVVENYDIDAVHFDDYFYPYPAPGTSGFPDNWAYEQFGNGMDRADWRRSNINEFIENLSIAIRESDRDVQFGVSPFGVWRSRRYDPEGSIGTARGSFDTLYADTRLWVREGWIDYVVPQLYWDFNFAPAPYEGLLNFWIETVRENPDVNLYIGLAAYRVGTGGAWDDVSEIPRQIALNRTHPEVQGHIHFSIDSLLDNPLGLRDVLMRDVYQENARLPEIPRLSRD
jgi:uncharacterized lipoprotein YddW (UPF0748 family)